MGISAILITLLRFYTWLIVIYVLMSWFPVSGVFADIQRALGSIVEPYLSIFRRIIPPIGMIDISPIVAYLVLQAVMTLIATAL